MKNGMKYDTIAREWYIEKTPGAVLNYGHDWSRWLADELDAINTSAWAISAVGLVIDSAASEPSGKTFVFLSGGVVGSSYKVTNTVGTVGSPTPRTAQRTFRVDVVATLSG